MEQPADNRQIPRKRAYAIGELKKLGGPCRANAYKAIGEGRLRAVKDGRSTKVLDEDFERYMTGLPPIEPKPGPLRSAPQRRRHRNRTPAADMRDSKQR